VAEYVPQTARVIGRSPTVWYSTVTVDKGSSSDVEVDDPVINGDGLVGRVTDVTPGAAQVTLITDHRSAVSATLLPDGPSGIVEPEVGDPDDLLLDFIENDDEVEEGQVLVTAGWSDGAISSAYPYGLEIGEVSETAVAEQETFQRIHVEPYADIRDLDWVQVLTGGPERPGIPSE
jgi:rod shape-determining protein MreC